MIIQGDDLMCFLGKTDQADDTKSIGCATNHTMNLTMNTKSLSHKDIGGAGLWEYFERGSQTWTVTSSNFVSSSELSGETQSRSGNKREGYGYEEIFDMMISKKPIYLVFGLEGSSAKVSPDSPDTYEGKLLEVPAGGWVPGKTYWGGWAWVQSLDINAPTGEYTTMEITFQGHGPLKKLKTDAVTFSNPEPVPVPVTTAKSSTKVESK